MRKNIFMIAMGTVLLMGGFFSCTGNKPQGGGNDEGTDSLAKDSMVTDAMANVDWQDVSDEEALAFIEEFYSHAPQEEGSYAWDENILRQYLAPAVLDTLHAKLAEYGANDEQVKYATWLLTGIDDSEQILLSKQNFPAHVDGNGRYCKHFEVYYWADGMLDGVQELYYTVKSDGERLFITQIDSLNESGANMVWNMLEERNRWREVESKAEEMGGFENLSEEVVDSLYQHAFD